MKQFARFAHTIHLSNVQVNEIITYNHYPVLPELSPNDGWAPIEEYLNIIKEENDQVKIMFEHRSDWISDEQLDNCYQWVTDCLGSM